MAREKIPTLAFKLLYEDIKCDLKGNLEYKKYTSRLFFSMLAYYSEAFVKKTLFSLGAEKVDFYTIGSVQTYFVDFGHTCVIAFRGTEASSVKDFSAIINFKKQVLNIGYKVHTGFFQSVEVVKDFLSEDLEERLNPEAKIIYTGHSLGGALATLFAIVKKPHEVTTFGSPRLFNHESVVKLYDGVEINRVVTRHDFVRFLPFSILGYEHFGNEVRLPSRFCWRDLIHPHRTHTYLELLLDENNDIW